MCVWGGGGGVGLGGIVFDLLFFIKQAMVCVQYLTFFGGEAKYLTLWV